MEAATAELVAAGDEGENISDIQNYLQSFNKEIGESGSGDGQAAAAGTTFYAIDTSQVMENGGDGSMQTMAIVQGSGGNFVLIVQPQDGGDGNQIQVPENALQLAASGVTVSQDGVGDEEEEEAAEASVTVSLSGKRGSRVKSEGKGGEKANDISVYDFGDAGGADEEEDPDAGDPEFDEDEDEDLDSESESVAKTPKKRGSSAGGSAAGKKTPVRKQKALTPSTPSSAGSAQHMCNYCNYTSNKRYLLSRHMKSHSEERPHKCGICERGFKTIASLQNHVNTHTGVRPHACKYCEAAFTTSGELVRHVRYRHTHEKPHRCSECDYASVELSKLKRHMRCHTGERPYQCPHCTYASPDTYKLKRHLRIHTGEKPYECDVCHARFTQSNSLKAHRLIHSGNKPIYKCDLCPTTCGRKTDLRIHVQKLHTSDKPMTCKRCDQSFPDRYTFKQHLKSHEGEKCFKCDLCNYASVSARHLESHMLIHTDQKPFQCDECDQSFRQKQLLKRHKNLYHNPEYVAPQPKEKTHECSSCSKSFRHKGNLMRHMVIHDPENYKDGVLTLKGNEYHQLIDDESEEEEETDDELMDEDEDDEAESMDQQTLQFTLDPQTQQMLTGDQVVVFEVVQMPEGGDEGEVSDATFETTDASVAVTPVAKKSASGTRKTVRTATLVTQTNGAATSSDNIIIQLQAEDEEAANQIDGVDIIDDPEYEPPRKVIKVASTPTTSQSSVPPPIQTDDRKVRDQMQKEKDRAQCFGFKDDDDEDDAILSMPAAVSQ